MAMLRFKRSLCEAVLHGRNRQNNAKRFMPRVVTRDVREGLAGCLFKPNRHARQKPLVALKHTTATPERSRDVDASRGTKLNASAVPDAGLAAVGRIILGSAPELLFLFSPLPLIRSTRAISGVATKGTTRISSLFAC
ncbi:hypothetical protein E2553_32710 [Paraburkholderia dipogonis]|uniref:Uncharacterized protein n=1 Tax=Paraburkholderia dipogonis TaxID=1211383 RepID=A0A4Y8MVN2_9BURK|nr:hypothetical protein [Paraburkholderia dipogonis]TFE41432.1 hypothetical protein E2553_32710 [Paraburkholderia dipogonis]